MLEREKYNTQPIFVHCKKRRKLENKVVQIHFTIESAI